VFHEKRNDQRRYKYLVLGRANYFVKETLWFY